jgi:hypothetical protein
MILVFRLEPSRPELGVGMALEGPSKHKQWPWQTEMGWGGCTSSATFLGQLDSFLTPSPFPGGSRFPVLSAFPCQDWPRNSMSRVFSDPHLQGLMLLTAKLFFKRVSMAVSPAQNEIFRIWFSTVPTFCWMKISSPSWVIQ